MRRVTRTIRQGASGLASLSLKVVTPHIIPLSTRGLTSLGHQHWVCSSLGRSAPPPHPSYQDSRTRGADFWKGSEAALAAGEAAAAAGRAAQAAALPPAAAALCPLLRLATDHHLRGACLVRDGVDQRAFSPVAAARRVDGLASAHAAVHRHSRAVDDAAWCRRVRWAEARERHGRQNKRHDQKEGHPHWSFVNLASVAQAYTERANLKRGSNTFGRPRYQRGLRSAG